MLKFKYTTEAEIPAEHKTLYSQVGDSWVLTGVSGIKTQDDIDRLQEGLRKEREDHKATKDTLRSYQSIGDPEEIQTKLDRFDELEAASGDKIDEAKINEMVEARMKTRTAPLERQIAKLTEERDTLTGTVTDYQQKDVRRTIHDDLRKAATSAKVRDTALDDVLLYESVFTVDEHTKKVVTKDGVGVTPGIEASVWLSEVKNNKPHWWPESKGAGANGGDGTGGVANPFTAENWNLTEQGALIKADRNKADQMAKSAGTTIGGKKPAPVGK